MSKFKATEFASFLKERAAKKDGYAVYAIGEYTKELTAKSKLISQYKSDKAEYKKALYWLENSERLWDCQGLLDGWLTEKLGQKTDSQTFVTYAQWCSPKGTGSVPSKYRMPGTAVFIYYASLKRISHIGYLTEPVNKNNPAGDWFVVEAAGIYNGVITTRLSNGYWNRWGLISKYLEYTPYSPTLTVDEPAVLRRGDISDAVRAMQTNLTTLGYSLGKIDGDFGTKTGDALFKFQKANGLAQTGVYDLPTQELVTKLLSADAQVKEPESKAVVTGGSVRFRASPSLLGKIIKTVHSGDEFVMTGNIQSGWVEVRDGDKTGWISDKYVKILK